VDKQIKLDDQQSAFLEGFLQKGVMADGARLATGKELAPQQANDFADKMMTGMPIRQILPSIYTAAGFNPTQLIENLVNTALNASVTVKLNKFETEERPDYKARNDATELLFKMLGAMDAAKVMKSKTSIHITHTEPALGDSPFEAKGTVIDGTSRPS